MKAFLNDTCSKVSMQVIVYDIYKTDKILMIRHPFPIYRCGYMCHVSWLQESYDEVVTLPLWGSDIACSTPAHSHIS